MIVLDVTTSKLQVVLAAAHTTNALDCYAAWRDLTSSTYTPGASKVATNGTTDVDFVAAPASSTQRLIDNAGVYNRDTVAHTVTIKTDDSGTEKVLWKGVVGVGEKVEYGNGVGWRVLDSSGRAKSSETIIVGTTGLVLDWLKIGTASEAAGVRYGFANDTGLPGAWSPGAPGVNGWWVDATQASNAANPAGASQAGSYQLQNPSSGAWYLNDIGLCTSVAHLVEVLDLIWYNTGLVVTTTTAQAIAMPGSSKPARDMYGSTNGDGWNAYIYVTTATTNAGAVTNTTLNYTNSDGTAGRTGTISSFPATAVAGTLVPFQLAAGDRGIRSIEGVTLGTSYAGGAISLVLLRKIASVPNPVANVGGIMNKLTTDPTGVRLYSGTAFWFGYVSSTTTATTLQGSLGLVAR